MKNTIYRGFKVVETKNPWLTFKIKFLHRKATGKIVEGCYLRGTDNRIIRGSTRTGVENFIDELLDPNKEFHSSSISFVKTSQHKYLNL